VVPAPPLAPILHFANEVSVSSMVNFHTDLNTGYGVSTDSLHYFTRLFGVAADAEYLTSNVYNLTEYAFRAGPTVRIHDSRRFTVFAKGLAGYARYKATYTAPQNQKSFKGPDPYENAPSMLVGVGTDVHLAGGLSARVAGDLLYDVGSRNDSTRLLRLSMGFAYSFGSTR
jgi:hypothetical protein